MSMLMSVWEGVVDWLANGLIDTTWWQVLAFTLVVTHITIAAVTIFLHRSQAHRALDLHPIPSHFFRFWLWLTTGMVTKEWVAIHRKHHAKCETDDDPHSPQTRGIKTVLLTGSELYRAEAKVQETLTKYGHGTPDDWIERNLYTRFSWQGVGLMLIVNLMLFGAIGATVWAVQMLWIPITAAGIINGIGHWWGYRNFEAVDASTNVSPWGIIIGGEELHNNHHTYPTSAKLSVKPYEFDIGWAYIRGLETLGLAKVRKTPPKLALGSVNHRQPLRGDGQVRGRVACCLCDRTRAPQGAGCREHLALEGHAAGQALAAPRCGEDSLPRSGAGGKCRRRCPLPGQAGVDAGRVETALDPNQRVRRPAGQRSSGVVQAGRRQRYRGASRLLIQAARGPLNAGPD
jgi:fatty-acid desaturase